ncbi:MAG: molybdopterin-dependent oxidoreductase, partial [Deltaproteobacteria bacterium]|nr:molybdopterin-dependent oxidoreductase [Deltaproteobacteria bacterium]
MPAGAFRGIGSVQLGWACEAHTDHICTELGYDPIEFRLKNLLRAGEKYVLGGPPLDGNPHDALTACMELF